MKLKPVTRQNKPDSDTWQKDPFQENLTILSNFIDSVPIPTILFDQEGSLLFSNRLVEKLTGFSFVEVIGKKPPYPWFEWNTSKKLNKNCCENTENQSGSFEDTIRTKDGKFIPVKTNTISIWENHELHYFVSYFLDQSTSYKENEPQKETQEAQELIINGRVNKLIKANARLRKQIGKRKQIEKELLESREQLRELSYHLQFIREEERKTVAREIHDELGQALTALKYDSSWLIDRLSGEQEDLRDKIQSMIEIIDSTIQQVKKISSELRPAVLDDLGIVDAIEWQARCFQNATGISCDFYSDINGLILDPSQSTTVFRIFQEAITNIARHADATKVNILLTEEKNKVILRVRDNGKGIEENQISDYRSLGLLGMKERALSCKGDLKIRGFRGHGSVATLSIPINNYMVKLVWSPLIPPEKYKND